MALYEVDYYDDYYSSCCYCYYHYWHTHIPLCGYELSTGPTEGLSLWWLEIGHPPPQQPTTTITIVIMIIREMACAPVGHQCQMISCRIYWYSCRNWPTCDIFSQENLRQLCVLHRWNRSLLKANIHASYTHNITSKGIELIAVERKTAIKIKLHLKELIRNF